MAGQEKRKFWKCGGQGNLIDLRGGWNADDVACDIRGEPAGWRLRRTYRTQYCRVDNGQLSVCSLQTADCTIHKSACARFSLPP